MAGLHEPTTCSKVVAVTAIAFSKKYSIHSFYLAFITAVTAPLEQITSLNTSLLKSFCPNA
jgi:hypothetical protein